MQAHVLSSRNSSQPLTFSLRARTESCFASHKRSYTSPRTAPSKDSLLSCDAVRGELRVMQILISVSPAITSKPDTPARILTAATVIFSGSIYGLCLLPAGHALRKVLGPATPMGGLLFIAGWLSLGFSTGLRTSR